jgi:sulfofructose kinase
LLAREGATTAGALPMRHTRHFGVDVLCVGHASFDLVMAISHHPGPDEKCSATPLIQCGGGPAANAAVAVARLGGTSAFAGYLGEDFYGDRHLEELCQEGVRTDLVRRGTYPTPLSCILVKPNGSRTVVNCKTGTPFLEIAQIHFACCSPNVILFDGHEPQISLLLAKSARDRGIATVLDAGSVHQGTEELLPRVDYLVASEKFARDFTGEQDIHRALQSLHQRAPTVAVSLGERGLVWKNNRGEGTIPAFYVEALDTTGAGDTLHGAFALEIARKERFISALTFACAAAALSCKNYGARPSIPTRPEVEAFLNQQEGLPDDPQRCHRAREEPPPHS